MLLTKVKTFSAFICVALSLLVLPNNAVLADDGKLTNEKANQLISQLFNKQPDKLEVIGVMEPSQNVAQADVVITNLLIARPKNDAVTAYAFGPGGGSYLWSGSGKANFVHYNDGRWVLTRLDTEAGSFSPKAHDTSALAQQPQVSSQGPQPVPVSTIHKVDFIHNGITIPDPNNAGNYILAGDRQWPCTAEKPGCRIGPPGKFSIMYISSTKYFGISIGEPLAQSRKAAQEFLMKTLGITASEMCGLMYSVGTTVYDDYDYAGKELRFSFCPGAINLPIQPSNRHAQPRAG